ncbi:MAG: hypothetical protein LUG60_01890, partial [Erysipelotrichaceae bacterium]|nr:hypothetical protein [Erysipelotrichaceae bacterium]
MRKRTKKKLFDAFKILMAIVMTVTLLNVSNYSASATEIAQEDTVEEVTDEQEETLETEEVEEEAVEEETTEEEEIVEEDAIEEEIVEEDTVEEESVEATETKTEYVYEDSKVKVTVKLQEGTTVDANAELSVKEIKEGTDAYNNAISKLDDDDAIDRVIYDISFISNGEEVEPDGKVDVAIEFIKNVLTLEDEDNYTVAVTHITDDGKAETLDVDVDTNDGEVEGLEFVTDSFSVYQVATYGSYTLSYNNSTNTFLQDEYSAYYNSSSGCLTESYRLNPPRLNVFN